MTTAWSNVMRGRLLAALQANTGGALLALLVIWLGPWLLMSGIRGRWIGRPLGEGAAVALCVAIVGVTLIDWVWRLLLVGR